MMRIVRRVAQITAVLGCLLAAHGADAADYNEELTRIGKDLTGCLSGLGNVKVAALDFTDLQGNVTELGRLLAEQLSTELAIVGAADGLQVIDRNHLATILKEHELGSSGLIDPETAKKLGQFAGIDIVITGSVLALEDSIQMTVKGISTETASIRCASRGEFPKTMTMREMLAVGIDSSSSLSPGPAVSRGDTRHEAYQADIEGATVGGTSKLTVRLKSFTKTRDGKQVHLALSLTPSPELENPLGLFVNDDALPMLIDNVGTEWTFHAVGGLERASVEELNTYTPPITWMEPGVDSIITLVFKSNGSAGSQFSLGGSLGTCGSDTHCKAYKTSGTSIGLANIALR